MQWSKKIYVGIIYLIFMCYLVKEVYLRIVIQLSSYLNGKIDIVLNYLLIGTITCLLFSLLILALCKWIEDIADIKWTERILYIVSCVLFLGFSISLFLFDPIAGYNLLQTISVKMVAFLILYAGLLVFICFNKNEKFTEGGYGYLNALFAGAVSFVMMLLNPFGMAPAAASVLCLLYGKGFQKIYRVLFYLSGFIVAAVITAIGNSFFFKKNVLEQIKKGVQALQQQFTTETPELQPVVNEQITVVLLLICIAWVIVCFAGRVKSFPGVVFHFICVTVVYSMMKEKMDMQVVLYRISWILMAVYSWKQCCLAIIENDIYEYSKTEESTQQKEQKEKIKKETAGEAAAVVSEFISDAEKSLTEKAVEEIEMKSVANQQSYDLEDADLVNRMDYDLQEEVEEKPKEKISKIPARMHIAGNVKGNLSAQYIVLEEGAIIYGNVVAKQVIVRGTVKGGINVRKFCIKQNW